MGDVAVTYRQYPGADDVTTVFDAAVAEAGAEDGRCEQTAASRVQNYHRGVSVVAGRILCAQSTEGAQLLWTQADRPTVLGSATLPGSGEVNHAVYDRWAADEFGPQVPAGTPVPRAGCAPGEC